MWQLTRALVESLLKDPTTLKLRGAGESISTEIIVVDNNSGDDSVYLLRSDFPEITVIDNKENLGLAAGVNVGIKHATGTYYLVLNPDMIALPGSVQTLVDFMDKNPAVGIAGGKLISPNGKLQYSCYKFYTPMTIVYRRTLLGKTDSGKATTRAFLMKDFDHKEITDVDWLMGACLIVRKKACDEVGGMDEQFFLYFEDVDWCRRMWEANWRVTYVPQAVFSHFHQRSSEKGALLGIFFNRPTREHIKSAIKYFVKFRGKNVPKHA